MIQLQEVIETCKFYSEVEDCYKNKDQHQKFGFNKLRTKYQEKFNKNLKNDEERIKQIIIGYNPSKISFTELKSLYQKFKSLKNVEQGNLKRSLITSELAKIEQKIMTDLAGFKIQIGDNTLANNKVRLYDFLQTFHESEILQKNLNDLYTLPEDINKISISQGNLEKIRAQVAGYYFNQFDQAIELLKENDSVRMKQKLKAFTFLENVVFETIYTQEKSKQKNKLKSYMAIDKFVNQHGDLLKKNIQTNPKIKTQEKKKAESQKTLAGLITILNKAVQSQLKSKYQSEASDSSNFVIDQGFRKYYNQVDEKTKVNLNFNVENHFRHIFQQYSLRFNTSKDLSQRIKSDIENSIFYLPKQIKLKYQDQFKQLQKTLTNKTQEMIIKTAQNFIKNPKKMNDFIKSVKQSNQNKQTQFHSQWVNKFNEIYTELFQKQARVQQKIQLIQHYFINLHNENKQFFKNDKQMLQVLSHKYKNELEVLKQQSAKRLNQVKLMLENHNNISKQKNNRAEIGIIFKIYQLFIQISDNQITDTKIIKANVRNEYQKKLQQCISIYNKNIEKKPNVNLDSQDVFDSQKNKILKDYISSMVQTGQIVQQLEKQLQAIQSMESKYKIQTFTKKLPTIKKYKPVIQSYQKEFQQIRNFLRQYDFFGDIKRNLSTKELERDLDKLNVYYKILEQKQENYVLLFFYQGKSNKFIFKQVAQELQIKFNRFVEEVQKEIKRTFQTVDGEPSFKVNLLMNELQILKEKRKELSFIKKDKVRQTFQKTKNMIKQQFDRALKKCKQLFDQSKLKFESVYKQLKVSIDEQKKQLKLIKEQCSLQFRQKKQVLTKDYEEKINIQVNQYQKVKLKKSLATQLVSIQNQINDGKDKKIHEIQEKYRQAKNKHNQFLETNTNQFGMSLMIFQKGLVDIIYNVGAFKEPFEKIIEDIKKVGPKFVQIVQKNLANSEDSRSIGKLVLSSHKTFSNFSINIINNLIKGQDIKYVVTNLEKIMKNGRQKMKEKELKEIEIKYQEFKQKYQDHKKKYQREPTQTTINSLIGPLKSLGNQIKEQFYYNKNPRKQSLKKVELLAGIFALWAIIKSQTELDQVTFTIEPHPTQITTLFLLLGITHPDEILDNRLAQVGTGQGKSIVLAGLSCYLALVGFRVRCACYSIYLSKRDQENFKQLFQKLGVENSIKYGTFNELCEDILNSGGKNIKQQIEKMVLSQSLFDKIANAFGSIFKSLKNSSKITQNPTILVIDEVDVFFEDSFFGRSYCPGINLKGDQVTKAIEYVWRKVQQKKQKVSPEQIIKSQAFKNLVKKYPTLQRLLENQVHGMIAGALNYKHDYHIIEKRICYKDGDAISYKISYGYKTVFANIYEFENNKVSQTNLDQALQISLMIAQFSYAQLPSYFQNILGVTGTLQVLPKYKKRLLIDRYQIIDQYAIPSAFGINKKRIEAYTITPQASYQQAIIKKINQVKDSRPIIIFFKGPNELNQFANSSCYQQFLYRTNNLTEYHDASTRDSRIISAVNPKKITLMSSAFGRGTDFIILDDKIKQNGGLHVIQAFLSLDESEEIQIKGRTARQNSKGSYDCILSQAWLEQLDLKSNQIPENSASQFIHQHLLKGREEKIQKLAQSTLKLLKEADLKHQQVFKIFAKDKLKQADLIGYVENLNKYPLLRKIVIKTVLGLDATGSMSTALKKTCLIIGDAFERSYSVLNKQKVEATIEVQIKVYRNYNSSHEMILQGTAFESTPVNLKRFLQSVGPEGGWKNQAIQVLFQSLNKEQRISQVILIGDAPPNTMEQVRNKRRKRGQDYWQKYGFPITDIGKQLDVFAQKKCPVHSFYLNNGDGFKQISEKTKGTASLFKINSPTVTNDLTGFIVENILTIVGKECNNTNLVQTYRKMYVNN